VMLDFPLQVLPSAGTGSSGKEGMPARHPLREPGQDVEMR